MEESNNTSQRLLMIIKNKIFIAIIIFILIVIGLSLAYALKNHNMSTEKQALLKIAQDELKPKKKSSLDVSDVHFRYQDWKVWSITFTGKDTAGGLGFITKGDKVIATGTYFSIDDLVKKGAPDPVIEYFYPDKPWVINASVAFESSSAPMRRKKKAVYEVIKFFANQNNIEPQKITFLDNIERDTLNKRQDNETSVIRISFKLNNDPKVYKFQSEYIVMEARYVYKILDEKNNVILDLDPKK